MSGVPRSMPNVPCPGVSSARITSACVRLIEGAGQVGCQGGCTEAAARLQHADHTTMLLMDSRVHLLRFLGMHPCQQGFDMRLEFGRMRGFCQVVVRTGFEAGDLIIQLRFGSEKQDGGALR